MRILLVQPPIEDFYITTQRLQPVGLFYVGSALKESGHTVRILDLLSIEGSSSIPYPPELSYLSQYYEEDISPLRIFTSYRRFGASEQGIRDSLSSAEFDLVGISSNFTCYWKQALEVARIAKEIRPQSVVVVGGNSVPVTGDTFLKSGFVDHVLLGEGEPALLSLVGALEKKENPPPKIGPLPFDINRYRLDFSLFNPSLYRIGKNPSLSLVTSRGCPMGCSFCTAMLNCGSGYQRKSLDLLFDEIKEAVRLHSICALNIEDENFTLDRNFAISFLRRKIDLYPAMRLYFMNGLHYFSLDDELLELLRNADCLNLGLALVDTGSAGESVRKTDLGKLTSIVHSARRLGFLVTVYVIAGLPGQTAADVRKMIDTIRSLDAVVGVSIYYSVPGTALYDQIYGNGYTGPGIAFSQMRSSALAFEQETLTRKQMVDLLRYSRIVNLSGDPIPLPEYSVEQNDDTLIIRMERQFTTPELKTLMIRWFKERDEFLVLKRIKNGTFGAAHFFRRIPSQI